jgi:hypothetical protein
LLTRSLEATGEGEALLVVTVSSAAVSLDRILLRPAPNRAR